MFNALNTQQQQFQPSQFQQAGSSMAFGQAQAQAQEDNPFSTSSVLKQKRGMEDNDEHNDTVIAAPQQSAAMPGFKRRMTDAMQESSNDAQMQMGMNTADQLHAFDPSINMYQNGNMEQSNGFFSGTTFVPQTSGFLEAAHSSKHPMHKLSTSSFTSSAPFTTTSSSLNSPAASTFSSYAFSTSEDSEMGGMPFQQDSPDHRDEEITFEGSHWQLQQGHPCNSGMDEEALRRYYDSYNGNGYGEMMYDAEGMEDSMAGRYTGNGGGDSYAAKLEGVMGHV